MKNIYFPIYHKNTNQTHFNRFDIEQESAIPIIMDETIQSHYFHLIEENKKLKDTVAFLKADKMNSLASNSENIIEVRDIPIEQVKQEVLDLVNKKGKMYYSEIADELNLYILDVINACEQLEQEGAVREASK
jgi:hypothetical protein